MKKPTKSTTTNKVQTPRGQRHSAVKKKPVTIDLKAQKVEGAKTASTDTGTAAAATAAAGASSQPKKTATPKSSVPSARRPQKSDSTTAKTKSSNDSGKARDSSGAGFGRNGSTTDSKKSESTASPKSTRPSEDPHKGKNTSGMFVTACIAAIVGGGVALGVASLLQYSGFLNASGSAQISDVQKSVDGQTEALRVELETLRSRLENLASTSGDNVSSEALAELIDTRVDKRFGQISQDPSNPKFDAIVTQLNETTLRVEQLLEDQTQTGKVVSTLQTAVNRGGAGGGAALAALGAQVDNLSSRTDRTRSDLKQIKTDIVDLAGQANTASQAVSTEISGRVAALEALVQGLPDHSTGLESLKQELAATRQSLEQQGKNLEQINAGLTRSGSSEKLAAQSVAAAALKSDIDRGLPFTNSLNLLRNLTPEDSNLTQLASYAEFGVPSATQLSASFEKVGQSIIDATDPKPANDLTSRLLAGVKSFVKVKARKKLDGSSPLALVSQITQAMTDGDLSEASSIWNQLPEEGQTVSKPWQEQLQSRIIADELISSSIKSFLSSTATR